MRVARKFALLIACATLAGCSDGPAVTPYVDADISTEGGIIRVHGKSEALSGAVIGPVDVSGDRALLRFSLSNTDKLAIRLDRAGEEPAWIAPKAENVILLQDEDDAEVTVYGQVGYRFEMSRPSVETCVEPFPMECLSPGDIRQIANLDLPDDLSRKVAMLTDWISNEADFSLTPSIAKKANEIFPPLNAAQIVRGYYDQDTIAGFCGGTAVFAAKVLQEFGVDAFTVNFGIPGGDLTHVSVVWRDESGRFYFADPTFNGTFLKDGRPADIFAELGDATFQGAPVTKREYLFRKGEADEVLDLFIPNPTADCEEPPTGGLLVCRRQNYTINDYFSMFDEMLSAHSLASGPEAFIFLFRQGVFSVGDGLRSETRSEFLSAVQSAGIPIH